MGWVWLSLGVGVLGGTGVTGVTGGLLQLLHRNRNFLCTLHATKKKLKKNVSLRKSNNGGA